METGKTRRMWGATAMVAGLSILGVACGGDTETPNQAEDSPAAVESPAMPIDTETGIDTEAAQLQQGLTDLLDSHVFLAGIAVEQAALTKDPESPQFTAAAEALDQNSQDLAAAIESVYGPEAGEQFLELWRQHIDFFVQYTVGGLTGDTKAQDEAKTNLDQYRQDFGAFIDSATGGELPSDAVASALQEHVDSLLGTIDIVITGKGGNPFMSLYESASNHMPSTASALAGGIIAANPDQFGS